MCKNQLNYNNITEKQFWNEKWILFLVAKFQIIPSSNSFSFQEKRTPLWIMHLKTDGEWISWNVLKTKAPHTLQNFLFFLFLFLFLPPIFLTIFGMTMTFLELKDMIFFLACFQVKCSYHDFNCNYHDFNCNLISYSYRSYNY